MRTCAFCRISRAFITRPSASKDLFMKVASRNTAPVACDFLLRSEPARSTRFSLEKVWLPVHSYTRMAFCVCVYTYV